MEEEIYNRTNWKLRRWESNDIDNLVKYANNYNIAKCLTDQFPHPYTLKDGESFLKSIMEDEPAKVLAIEIDGKAAGSIGVFPQSDIHCKNAEMGYWLAEEYWGRGIMTEVIKEMVKYGFQTFDITRIFARPFGINKASQRVLEKAGFVKEACLPDALFKNGVYMDELIYAIRKSE